MFGDILNIILTALGAFISSGWIISVAMLVILPKRQSPEAARTWLVVMFFLPWLGLLIYLLIGENRLPKDQLKRHAQMVEKLINVDDRIKQEATTTQSQLDAEQKPIVSLAEGLGHMPILDGNDFELIFGYDNIIDRIIDDIDGAERHVHLLYYIIADDETGRRVTEALVRAVKRGVKCRVLVDHFGALPFIKELGDDMIEQGIDLHYILPIKIFRRYLTRVDLRNHRKIAVIDGQMAYTGSQNIVNADYGYHIEGLIYEELMVRLTGPIVMELQAIFVGDWYIETDELLTGPDLFSWPVKSGDTPIQALPSGPTYGTQNFQRMMVSLVHQARERVVITTPYFIPDEPFLEAMQTAVLSGVEVVLIVSGKVDQVLVGLAQDSYYEELLEAGVKIYIHGKSLLHAKHTSIDNEIALIGSGNMDQRSFDLNFEISMLFYDTQAVEALHAKETGYIEDSEQLTREVWAQRSAKERFLQNTAKLISPLL